MEFNNLKGVELSLFQNLHSHLKFTKNLCSTQLSVLYGYQSSCHHGRLRQPFHTESFLLLLPI